MGKFSGRTKSKHTNHAGQETVHQILVKKIGTDHTVRSKDYKTAARAKNAHSRYAVNEGEIALPPREILKERD